MQNRKSEDERKGKNKKRINQLILFFIEEEKTRGYIILYWLRKYD